MASSVEPESLRFSHLSTPIKHLLHAAPVAKRFFDDETDGAPHVAPGTRDGGVDVNGRGSRGTGRSESVGGGRQAFDDGRGGGPDAGGGIATDGVDVPPEGGSCEAMPRRRHGVVLGPGVCVRVVRPRASVHAPVSREVLAPEDIKHTIERSPRQPPGRLGQRAQLGPRVRRRIVPLHRPEVGHPAIRATSAHDVKAPVNDRPRGTAPARGHRARLAPGVSVGIVDQVGTRGPLRRAVVRVETARHEVDPLLDRERDRLAERRGHRPDSGPLVSVERVHVGPELKSVTQGLSHESPEPIHRAIGLREHDVVARGRKGRPARPRLRGGIEKGRLF